VRKFSLQQILWLLIIMAIGFGGTKMWFDQTGGGGYRPLIVALIAGAVAILAISATNAAKE